MRALLSIALLSLASCASPATAEGMALSRLNIEQLPDGPGTLADFPPVAVRSVSGGSSTSPWGSPRVADEDFESALTISLRSAGAPATNGTTGLYLEAELLALEHPAGALDMPAHVTVRYRLLVPERDVPIYDHSIRSGYIVPASAAFSGVGRLRLAIEGAVRENITTLIRGLAELRPASYQP